MNTIKSGIMRRYRDEKRYSQAFVANKLGITQSAYQKIETGDVKITLDRLAQIATVLEKKIEDFIGCAEKSSPPKDATVQHHKQYNFMEKIILQQAKWIEELELKLKTKDNEIEDLKRRLAFAKLQQSST
ncbi:helix-turn-helix transcriptional regulator [Pedobacter sp. KR3-3]|uniref:Helix-turn-helix transcriptional regulator n=1 Tax=Pedobacter albus TaxID=3113905 RepID=A0ABU7ID12_9SPHI|nr:helix-turn-helix transcriptional regulator [Pedobacter sp. KR3-3]MEE1947064.1 helix-turn-helix transcriptional regulator [Pedobacter sp. KR3-3]